MGWPLGHVSTMHGWVPGMFGLASQGGGFSSHLWFDGIG
jgi:hypothetical protein